MYQKKNQSELQFRTEGVCIMQCMKMASCMIDVRVGIHLRSMDGGWHTENRTRIRFCFGLITKYYR
jgi:hypothetical protein